MMKDYEKALEDMPDTLDNDFNKESAFWLRDNYFVLRSALQILTTLNKTTETRLRWIPLTERMPTKKDGDPFCGEVMWMDSDLNEKGYIILPWNHYRTIKLAHGCGYKAFLPLNWLPKWEGER